MKISGIEINESDFLTVEQTSEILGRSKSTLDKDRHYKRGLPYTNIGQRIFYRASDIIEVLTNNRVEFKK